MALNTVRNNVLQYFEDNGDPKIRVDAQATFTAGEDSVEDWEDEDDQEKDL